MTGDDSKQTSYYNHTVTKQTNTVTELSYPVSDQAAQRLRWAQKPYCQLCHPNYIIIHLSRVRLSELIRVLEGADVSMYGLTRLRKPENFERKNIWSIRRATTTLQQAYTRIRTQVAVVTSECFTTTIYRPGCRYNVSL